MAAPTLTLLAGTRAAFPLTAFTESFVFHPAYPRQLGWRPGGPRLAPGPLPSPPSDKLAKLCLPLVVPGRRARGRAGRKWVWGKHFSMQWPAPLPARPVSEGAHGFQNSVQGAARGSAERRLLPSPKCPCSEVQRPYSQSPGFVSLLLVRTCWCDSAQLPCCVLCAKGDTQAVGAEPPQLKRFHF